VQVDNVLLEMILATTLLAEPGAGMQAILPVPPLNSKLIRALTDLFSPSN